MKTYLFIVRYNMDDLDGEWPESYWLADNYLIKLMKDNEDVVHIGHETELPSMKRELFFKAEGLDATLDAMGEFSENDEDFTKSYMDTDETTSLTMQYEETDPIGDHDREYSKEAMDYDPREAMAMMEDDFEEAMAMLDDDFEDDDFEDDDFGGN